MATDTNNFDVATLVFIFTKMARTTLKRISKGNMCKFFKFLLSRCKGSGTVKHSGLFNRKKKALDFLVVLPNNDNNNNNNR